MEIISPVILANSPPLLTILRQTSLNTERHSIKGIQKIVYNVVINK